MIGRPGMLRVADCSSRRPLEEARERDAVGDGQ